MSLSTTIAKTIELLFDLQGVHALLTWPKFSLTSYRMVSALKQQGIEPKTVIDVGANVGQFTVATAQFFPNIPIYSFEPLPECVTQLKQHIAHFNNVVVYPLALGDSEGETRLHVNVHSHSSSILPLAQAHQHAFPNAKEINTISVKMNTLDNVFQATTFHPPVLLKLDVQGYEAITLQGGIKTLQRVDYVILEVSFKPMYQGEKLFMDIVALMNHYHFKFLRPVGWLSAPKTGEILQMDALFVQQ